MDALLFHTLELAPAAEAQKLSEPFPVLYADTFKRPDFPKGELTVSEDDLDNAVSVFNEIYTALGGIPLDEDHAFAEGKDAKAVGWIKQLWREGDKLMARVQWTDKAAASIAAGEWRLFSPEFTTDFHDESGKGYGFALVSGALTNRPFLRKLTPVALSERAREVIAESAAALQPFLPLSDVSDTSAERLPRMAEPTVTAKDVEDLTVALNEVRDEVKTLKADNVALTERADSADAKAEAAAKELADERLTAVLSQARREGRIDAKDETTTEFSELADKVGLDGLKAVLARIPAETIPLSEQGHGKDKPAATTAPEGVDELSHRAHVRAEEIVAEQGIDYAEAASIAFKEVSA